MKTITFILRVRFDANEVMGLLADPVSGWRGLFASLDELGIRLHEFHLEENEREEGKSPSVPSPE